MGYINVLVLLLLIISVQSVYVFRVLNNLLFERKLYIYVFYNVIFVLVIYIDVN